MATLPIEEHDYSQPMHLENDVTRTSSMQQDSNPTQAVIVATHISSMQQEIDRLRAQLGHQEGVIRQLTLRLDQLADLLSLNFWPGVQPTDAVNPSQLQN